MLYSVHFSREAEKELHDFSEPLLSRILKVIKKLSVSPRQLGCKKLQGKQGDLWRVRIGDYRIIYFIDDKILIVDIRRIAHRSEVYD